MWIPSYKPGIASRNKIYSRVGNPLLTLWGVLFHFQDLAICKLKLNLPNRCLCPQDSCSWQTVVPCPLSALFALKNSGRSKHCLSSVDSAIFFLCGRSDPSDFFPCPSRETRSHRKSFPVSFSFPVWSLVACLFKSSVIFNMWFFFPAGLKNSL